MLPTEQVSIMMLCVLMHDLTRGFGDRFTLLFKYRSYQSIPALYTLFSFMFRKDQVSTSDVATSLGAVGSRPINASRISQGVEVSVDVVNRLAVQAV